MEERSSRCLSKNVATDKIEKIEKRIKKPVTEVNVQGVVGAEV